MVLHPDVQAKAQAELAGLIGGERLPEISDRDSLPFINCILKEVLRWRSAVPLGEFSFISEFITLDPKFCFS